MGPSSAALLAIVQSVSMYCGLNGPGVSVEFVVYPNVWMTDKNRSILCLKRIWACTRQTTQAEVMDTRLFNCITQHVNGELK